MEGDNKDIEYLKLCEDLREDKGSDHDSLKCNNKAGTVWTAPEDEKLMAITENCDQKNWNKISQQFEDKSPIQCFYRYSKVIKPLLSIQSNGTSEEDKDLRELVLKYVDQQNGPKYQEK